MPDPRATIVLVHGAWHGPWCWELLAPRLRAQGLAVTSVDLPSGASPEPAGLQADVRHLNAVMKNLNGPLILCGHSYGGMVISASDTSVADIRHLAYVCAYMPEAGESVESSLRHAGERRPGHWIRRLADGRTVIDAPRAAARFYQDCSGQTQDWAVARLRSHWGEALAQPCHDPAWRCHPSTYVICAEDAALVPAIQREVYSARATRQVTLRSGHAPFLSRPGELAQVLVSLVQ